ncbi:MAG: 5-formyltetrahydrofolate cyclo-ligase [Burkholderiales bacterium]|nr:5-formyltetrahydrofolate cyclo-ligase [Burkholderiales bacterium]
MSAVSAATPLTGAALREAKRDLRESTLARRDALDAATHDRASQAIVEGIRGLASFTRASCLLLTQPFRSEWDSRPLVDAALARGATVALPRVDVAARMLVLHRVRTPATEIATGYRGIPEPLADLPRIDVGAIDWVLVPGVAFDAHGHRLGYGGGYYDRLLALVAPSVPRVAGALDVQIVPQVPSAPHDLTVDTIVTPSRIVVVDRA